MPKNIVICCDGTGEEFGDRNSNVIKLYGTLPQDQSQIAYYHPGLGTMGAPTALSKLAQWWTKMKGLAFGYGLASNIGDAYAYLMETYEEGDRVYLFGFSRGAYTVRALAAMLHMYGLLRPGNEGLVRYIARMFRSQSPQTFALAAKFIATFSRPCQVHFLGVWDTVSSVGWIYDPVKLPYTTMNPAVGVVRHAVSIDERRAYFRQNLWSNSIAGQDVQQVWFAGSHCDVGGGYKEPQSGLSKIALEWMLQEAAAAGLRVNAEKKDHVLGADNSRYASPDPTARLHNSLWEAFGLWWILELWPKRYWDATTDPPSYRWMWPLGRPRYMAAGSLLHDSVIKRMESLPSYRPRNLPQTYQVVPAGKTAAAD
jgi:uncharacterized protein (DUF2235 family)